MSAGLDCFFLCVCVQVYKIKIVNSKMLKKSLVLSFFLFFFFLKVGSI